MAEPIRKITLKDGGTRYWVVVDVGRRPNGRRDQRTMTFRTLKDARAAVSRTRSQVDSGVYVAPSKVTLSGYLDGWLDGKRRIKASTRSGYSDALKRVREHCGHQRLDKITKADVDAVVTAILDAGGSARTVVLTLTVLSQALDAAVREGILTRNVAALVERPRQDKPQMRRWTEDEMKRFLRTASEHRLHAAWRLSLYGLRRGEVLGLRWSDVDLGRSWRPELYSDTFGRLAAQAGVPPIRLHDCRHTALSVMVDRGVPISIVSAWGGHADPAFTLRQYVHATPDGITAAGAVLGAASAL